MAPVSFLPTQVYEEAKLNRMQGKAGRVRPYHSFISSIQQFMLIHRHRHTAQVYHTTQSHKCIQLQIHHPQIIHTHVYTYIQTQLTHSCTEEYLVSGPPQFPKRSLLVSFSKWLELLAIITMPPFTYLFSFAYISSHTYLSYRIIFTQTVSIHGICELQEMVQQLRSINCSFNLLVL